MRYAGSPEFMAQQAALSAPTPPGGFPTLSEAMSDLRLQVKHAGSLQEAKEMQLKLDEMEALVAYIVADSNARYGIAKT